MAGDRSVRCLSALRGASTARVLNLVSISDMHGDKPEYSADPLFESPVFNKSIILKHRLRSDETYLFTEPTSVATKVVIPFDKNDLRLGGQSFFYGQRGYQEAMRQLGNYGKKTINRDLTVLRSINMLPSLDPFLLREHLRTNEIIVADCYFAIADADKARMHEYVSRNIRGLIELASGGAGGVKAKVNSTSKLVSALLSNEVDERLEPLRATLSLSGEEFREGVFSWRGFLYYKWCMDDLWPEVMPTLRQVSQVRPLRPMGSDQIAQINAAKRNVINCVRRAVDGANKALGIYERSYAELIQNKAPSAFREFLLRAPAMFLDLGDKIGSLSHVLSFWRYRFAKSTALTAEADELSAIFQDFENSFGHLTDEADARSAAV